jgi:hypothetical protein
MAFAPDDVEAIGYVAGTTAYDYKISRDGRVVGTVRVPSVAHLVGSGQDVPAYIAARLTEVETSEGAEKLDAALAVVLEI